jgi:hypothetical protein
VLQLLDERLAWEQLDAETSKQHHAFCHYRDMGAVRSIDKAWHEHKARCEKKQVAGKKRAEHLWWNWASGFGWVARAEAWDREQHRLIRVKLSKDQVEAAARQARLAFANLQSLSIASRVILEAIQQDPTLLTRMVQQAQSSPLAALKYLEMAGTAARAMPGVVAVERLALGMNTELIEIEDKRAGSIGDSIATTERGTELAIALVAELDRTGEGGPERPGQARPPRLVAECAAPPTAHKKAGKC